MATETFEIRVVTRGTKRAARQLKNIGTASKSSIKFLGTLRALLVVVASIRVLKGLTDVADAFVNIQNRLRLVTSTTAELVAVQSELFKISQETRTSFEANAKIFNRVARSTLKMKLTFQELLDITRTLGQMVQIAGAEAQEAKGSLIQFSQGLAAGALTGDELRSVVEGLPPLADAIGKEFGLAGGELIAFAKAAGNDRILTTEKVIRGIQKAAEEMNEKFAEINPTIAGAFTVLSNAFTKFTGELNESTNIATGFARLIIRIGKNLNVVIESLAAFTVGLLAALGARILGRIIVRLVLFAVNLLTVNGLLAAMRFLLITAPLALFALALGAVAGAMFFLRDEIINVNGEITTFGDIATIVFGDFVDFVERVAKAFADDLSPAIKGSESDAQRLFNVLKNASTGVGKVVAGFIQFFSVIELIFRAITIGLASAILAILTKIEQAVNISIFLINKFRDKDSQLDEVEFVPKSALKAQLAEISKLVEDFTKVTGKDFRKNLVDEILSGFDDVPARAAALTKSRLAQAAKDKLTRAQLAAALAGAPKGGLPSKAEQLAAATKKSLKSLLEAISPLAKATIELAKARETLNKAEAIGVVTTDQSAEILRRTRRALDGVGNASTDFQEKLELLNRDVKDGTISMKEFRRAALDLKIGLLETSNDASAGFERFLLKLRKDGANDAQFINDAFSGAFESMTDALAEFATTGKISFRELANSIVADINRIAAKALASKIFGGFASTPGAGGDTDTFDFGSAISALFASGTGGGGGSFDSASLADGISNFAHGGQFKVGGSGGTDSQFVGFRASPDETVTVTTPNQSVGGVTVNMNIVTPDANSFRQSSSQIASDLGAQLERIRRRNG